MNPEDFTGEEFLTKLEEITKNLLFAYRPVIEDRPSAFLLGGQSGAGKTVLHKMIRSRSEGNPISIIGDDYRKFHPRFHQLQQLYGDAAVDHTAPWAGKMTEALIESLSAIGYNLIVEGTLRTSEVPLGTARLLKERGYSVSLALMAVKPEISLVSCQLRYEEMRLAGTTPRATDPAHHQKIVQQIVDNLSVLEESQMFDSIYLYTRSHECIYPQNGISSTASEALKEKLFGAWSPEEESHLLFLQERLKGLRASKP